MVWWNQKHKNRKIFDIQIGFKDKKIFKSDFFAKLCKKYYNEKYNTLGGNEDETTEKEKADYRKWICTIKCNHSKNRTVFQQFKHTA